MTIAIAGKTYPTRKPADLDAVLVAATGCNASENIAIVGGHPLPSKIAAAVRPFLGDDAPSMPELAALIESELARPKNTLIADIRKLFSSVEPASTDKKEG